MDKNTNAPSVEQIAQVARLAARLMLESGGETYRAEDIANHIAHHFGLTTDIIAFPTGLTMTLTGENEVSSVIARVDRMSTDLMKVEQVNTVSRDLCSGRITLEEAHSELLRIQKIKPDGIALNVLYAAGGAALFGLMFGGGWFEILASGFAAAVIQLVLSYSPDQAGMPVSSLFAGFLASVITLLLNLVLGPANVNMTIVSTLMPFLPGLALTNAVRDSMRGDLLSSGARLGQAITRAVVLAGGAGAGLWLYLALGGVMP
ncbi:MAG: threonine/serine exporter family protein [Clostridia bacterium]|nr:threonine/serine exporter family protein [Clostridia bacterium]